MDRKFVLLNKKSSSLQLPLLELFLGLGRCSGPFALKPLYPAVKALICLSTIMLMQLGLTLLTSAIFFFFSYLVERQKASL